MGTGGRVILRLVHRGAEVVERGLGEAVAHAREELALLLLDVVGDRLLEQLHHVGEGLGVRPVDHPVERGEDLLGLLVLVEAVVDEGPARGHLLADGGREELLLDRGVDGELADDALGRRPPLLVGTTAELPEQLLDVAVVTGEQLDCVHRCLQG